MTGRAENDWVKMEQKLPDAITVFAVCRRYDRRAFFVESSVEITICPTNKKKEKKRKANCKQKIAQE